MYKLKPWYPKIGQKSWAQLTTIWGLTTLGNHGATARRSNTNQSTVNVRKPKVRFGKQNKNKLGYQTEITFRNGNIFVRILDIPQA